tara:strand:- start:383 stop:1060 length:678 start_codon:yes stop_codon:yes gene_type:complete
MGKVEVVILGVGIGADIIYGYLMNDERYLINSFAVETEYIKGNKKFGLPVHDLKSLTHLYETKAILFIMGIGYANVNQTRARIFNTVKDMGFNFETYIHPSAVVSSNANLEEGAMVLSNSVIEPYARVGFNSLVWSNCTIAHHSEVGDHCWVASNSVLSGQAKVNDYSFIGVGCVIVNEVVVGDGNIIGAGSLITKNTKHNEVYLMRNAEKHRFDALNYAKYFMK